MNEIWRNNSCWRISRDERKDPEGDLFTSKIRMIEKKATNLMIKIDGFVGHPADSSKM
jgi:hypothetical protein